MSLRTVSSGDVMARMSPTEGIGAKQRPRPLALSGAPATEEPKTFDTGALRQPERFAMTPCSHGASREVGPQTPEDPRDFGRLVDSLASEGLEHGPRTMQMIFRVPRDDFPCHVEVAVPSGDGTPQTHEEKWCPPPRQVPSAEASAPRKVCGAWARVQSVRGEALAGSFRRTPSTS